MKHAKKLAALLLALLLACALAVPALATNATNPSSNTYTITISNNVKGHTYSAYQIFTGDLHTEDSGEDEKVILSNVQWGSGVDTTEGIGEGDSATTLIDAIKSIKEGDQSPFSDCITAKDVANVLNGKRDDSDIAIKFAKVVANYLKNTDCSTSSYIDNSKVYTIENLAAGYYLVKDTTNNLSGQDFYTNYILKVVQDQTVTPKGASLQASKEVQDDEKQENEAEGPWGSTADYAIGDDVPFKLTATMPNNIADYETYKVVFNDTLGDGFTYDSNTSNLEIKVYNSEEDTNPKTVDVPTDAVTYDANQHKLTITLADIKNLTEKSEQGITDSQNKISITGNSRIVVTYKAKLNGTKTENDNSVSTVVIGSEGNPNNLTVTFSNDPNDDAKTGTTAESIVKVYTYEVVVNKVEKNPDYDANTEGSEEYTSLAGAAFKLQEKTGKDQSGEDTWSDGQTIETNDIATFEFKGLDAGTYKLTETRTPDGYNSIDPITFTITATHEDGTNGPELKSLTVDNNSLQIVKSGEEGNKKPTGEIKAQIENKKGSTLPSTGGMGTTLFYIIGGILVVVAGVLLVTKKRMDDGE